MLSLNQLSPGQHNFFFFFFDVVLFSFFVHLKKLKIEIMTLQSDLNGNGAPSGRS